MAGRKKLNLGERTLKFEKVIAKKSQPEFIVKRNIGCLGENKKVANFKVIGHIRCSIKDMTPETLSELLNSKDFNVYSYVPASDEYSLNKLSFQEKIAIKDYVLSKNESFSEFICQYTKDIILLLNKLLDNSMIKKAVYPTEFVDLAIFADKIRENCNEYFDKLNVYRNDFDSARILLKKNKE